jgi:hypothetical protein
MSTAEKTYVQGGADFKPVPPGKRTKKSLKAALKEDPTNVYLYDTSAFANKFSGPADTLPQGYVFNVVGPDPYQDRSWYASVYVGANGSLVCK